MTANRTPEPRLFLFARAPVLGTVKTRLAASIGDPAALDCYRTLLWQTVERLRHGSWSLCLAVTPDTAAASAAFWPPGPCRILQGSGDLGDRMLRLLATASPDCPVLIAGTDVPDLTAAHVERAIALLAKADLVVGPAGDGGYWLIGARRPVPETLFAQVRWSTGHARADTLRNASMLFVAEADTLDDIDTVADWERWRASTAAVAPG